MEDPTSTTPQSIMPKYPWLLIDDLDYSTVQPRVDAMALLGVPYGKAVTSAEPMAREQARTIAAEIKAQGGPAGLESKQIIALVAYLQRLGTDIKKTPRVAPAGQGNPVAGRKGAGPHAKTSEQNDREGI
jgi:cytochrome c oxidase cbb3-type subunit I/II